ncbi:MAG: hypothetical protein ACRCZ2_13620 [Fusobacteriaceae bacterium]
MTTLSKPTQLGETVKSHLKEIYLAETLGRRKIVQSKFLDKGTNREDESISLYRQVTGQFVIKNEKRYDGNPYLQGTPDLVFDDRIDDIKTSFDIFTYHKADYKYAVDNYFWQLVGYNLLVFGELKAGRLCFCLIDNTQVEIEKEIKKTLLNAGLDPIRDYESEQAQKYIKQIILNNRYDDIPKKKKLKIHDLDFRDLNLDNFYLRLDKCREYLDDLRL